MIIWILLFFLIISASFVLAYFSMKDYPEIPSLSINSIFLIRNPTVIDLELFENIKKKFNRGQIISFERLFKGAKSALVVFGPKELTKLENLDLLELEDYSKVEQNKALAWEVTIKGDLPDNIFQSLPAFNTSEQFWWQLALQVKKNHFQAQIRAVVIAEEDRKGEIAHELQNLLDGQLVKLPKPLSSAQILENFQKRSILPMAKDSLLLEAYQIIKLLGKA